MGQGCPKCGVVGGVKILKTAHDDSWWRNECLDCGHLWVQTPWGPAEERYSLVKPQDRA